MQKKFIFIVSALALLTTLSQSWAQSSRDALAGSANGSKFNLRSSDGRYSMGFKGHLQQNNQFSYRVADKKRDWEMELQRARVKVHGTAFDPSISYFFQAQFENADSQGDSKIGNYEAPGSSHLLDYYVNLAANREYAHIRIGKFRTPFARHQLTSTIQTQYAKPHQANGQFHLTSSDRDVGIMVHNGLSQQIEYALALVSNGMVARLGYNHGGIDGYEMTDFAGGDLRFAVALSGFVNNNYISTKFDDFRGSADFIVKYMGFSTNGVFYIQNLAKKNRMGAGLDLGYLINSKYEPVARYSWLPSGDDNHFSEITLGLNYYAIGNHLKVHNYVGANLQNTKIANYTGGIQFQFAL